MATSHALALVLTFLCCAATAKASCGGLEGEALQECQKGEMDMIVRTLNEKERSKRTWLSIEAAAGGVQKIRAYELYYEHNGSEGPNVCEAVQKTGSYKVKTSDGAVILRQSCVDGELDSESVRYYPDGKVMQVQLFKKGKLHGETVSFAVDGKIVERAQYQDGRWISSVP